MAVAERLPSAVPRLDLIQHGIDLKGEPAKRSVGGSGRWPARSGARAFADFGLPAAPDLGSNLSYSSRCRLCSPSLYSLQVSLQR